MRENYQGEGFRPYALAIGQAALAWSNLHEYLGCVFQALMAPRQDIGMAEIWHSATQDRALRQMLKAAIEYRYPILKETYPTALADVVWMIGQVDSLEEVRNNIVHSPLMYLSPVEGGPKVTPMLGGHRRAIKLAKHPDLLAEFQWCRDTALVLRDYASAMDNGLESAHPSWPDRPSLPNRGQKKEHQGPRLQPPSK